MSLNPNTINHQSQRFKMSCCDHLLSIVHHPSTPLLDLPSEIRGPIFFKPHVAPSVEGGLKFGTNGHDPLIKITYEPILRKNISKNIFSRTKKALRQNLGSIRNGRSTNFVQMALLGWPFYGKFKFASRNICIWGEC